MLLALLFAPLVVVFQVLVLLLEVVIWIFAFCLALPFTIAKELFSDKQPT
jgi:hypothetical protein